MSRVGLSRQKYDGRRGAGDRRGEGDERVGSVKRALGEEDEEGLRGEWVAHRPSLPFRSFVCYSSFVSFFCLLLLATFVFISLLG